MNFEADPKEQIRLLRRLITMQGAVNLFITIAWSVMLFGVFANDLDPNNKTVMMAQFLGLGVVWLAFLILGRMLVATVKLATIAAGMEIALGALMVIQLFFSGLEVVGVFNGLLAIALAALLLGLRHDLLGAKTPLATVNPVKG